MKVSNIITVSPEEISSNGIDFLFRPSWNSVIGQRTHMDNRENGVDKCQTTDSREMNNFPGIESHLDSGDPIIPNRMGVAARCNCDPEEVKRESAKFARRRSEK